MFVAALSGLWLLLNLQYLGVTLASLGEAGAPTLAQVFWSSLGSTLFLNCFLLAIYSIWQHRSDQRSPLSIIRILLWNSLITALWLYLRLTFNEESSFLHIAVNLNAVPALLSLIGYWHSFPHGSVKKDVKTPSPATHSWAVTFRLAAFPILVAVLASDLSELGSYVADKFWVQVGVLGLALILLSVFFPKWLHYVTTSDPIAQSTAGRPLARLIASFGLAEMAQIHLVHTEHSLAGAFALGGIGTKETILVSDRLIEELDASEILAVILHEQGHVNGRHGVIRIFAFMLLFILSSISVGTLSTLLGQTSEILLAVQVITVIICVTLSLACWSWLTHQLEFMADLVAVELMDGKSNLFVSPECLSMAILKLSGPLASRVTLTHPSAFQRSQRLRVYGASRDRRTKELARLSRNVGLLLASLSVVLANLILASLAL